MRKFILTILFVSSFLISNTSFSYEEDSQLCVDLKNEIRELMGVCRSCTTDQECVMDEEYTPSCPFGCSFLHSINCEESIMNSIKAKIDEYSQNCLPCSYECEAKPKSNDEVICRENLCVNGIFFQ